MPVAYACLKQNPLEKYLGFIINCSQRRDNYLPIFDEDAPNLADLGEVIAGIKEKITAGHRIPVHCWW
jgi:hypothetical protein